MKKLKTIIIVVILIVSASFNLYSQSLQETMTYISEQIQGYVPDQSNTNDIMFKDQLYRPILKDLIGYEASDDFFSNICVYNNIQYRDEHKTAIFYCTYAVFDVRDVVKISITRNGEASSGTSYIMKLYLRPESNALKIYEMSNSKDRQKITEVKIFLADDPIAINKIKKAFIHLGSLKGIAIKDGDLF